MNVIVDSLWLLCCILWYYIEAFFRMFVSPSAKSIVGEVALVTGAGRGIGREIALALAKQGARVAVCDINETECKETAHIINESGGEARAYSCDVTSVESVAKMASMVRLDLGDVNILVNNAGVLVVKNILELSDDEIRRTMNVNAVAQFWTVRQFLPSMIEKNHGHIVIIVSIAGRETSELLTDYCSSKFAAHGFSEALADDLRHMKVTGIDVTSVYPTFVDTNMVLDIKNRVVTVDRFQPQNLTPDQVSSAAVYGILHRRRYVYVPSHVSALNFLSLMPLKAKLAVKKFIQTGFCEVKSK